MTDELLPSAEPAGGLRAGVDFGVVFALAIEAGGLVDRMQGVRVTRGHGLTVRQGLCHDRQLVLVESGAGRTSAAEATHALLDAHRPTWVFSAGFAGGLVGELHRGDLLVADCLVDAEGRRWTADPATLPAWLANVRGLRVGRLLTCDRPVRLPAEKRALGAEHQALAVDMESLAVAEVCRQRNVPFLAVRVVCDAVDDELPPDVEKLLAQKTTGGQLGAALRSVWRRPASLKDLFAMQQNALACSDRLAQFLAGAVKHLGSG
ncbi:MAG: hypothetical protein ABSF26_21740 [Thermoguttaceae bacterium]|jgi:adenosylhomocysteine nucleosidase